MPSAGRLSRLLFIAITWLTITTEPMMTSRLDDGYQKLMVEKNREIIGTLFDRPKETRAVDYADSNRKIFDANNDNRTKKSLMKIHGPEILQDADNLIDSESNVPHVRVKRIADAKDPSPRRISPRLNGKAPISYIDQRRMSRKMFKRFSPEETNPADENEAEYSNAFDDEDFDVPGAFLDDEITKKRNNFEDVYPDVPRIKKRKQSPAKFLNKPSKLIRKKRDKDEDEEEGEEEEEEEAEEAEEAEEGEEAEKAAVKSKCAEEDESYDYDEENEEEEPEESNHKNEILTDHNNENKIADVPEELNKRDSALNQASADKENIQNSNLNRNNPQPMDNFENSKKKRNSLMRFPQETRMSAKSKNHGKDVKNNNPPKKPSTEKKDKNVKKKPDGKDNTVKKLTKEKTKPKPKAKANLKSSAKSKVNGQTLMKSQVGSNVAKLNDKKNEFIEAEIVREKKSSKNVSAINGAHGISSLNDKNNADAKSSINCCEDTEKKKEPDEQSKDKERHKRNKSIIIKAIPRQDSIKEFHIYQKNNGASDKGPEKDKGSVNDKTAKYIGEMKDLLSKLIAKVDDLHNLMSETRNVKDNQEKSFNEKTTGHS